MSQIYISANNPYRVGSDRNLYGIYPTVTVSDIDMKAWVWDQFEKWPIVSLATFHNFANVQFVPVGYAVGYDLTRILQEMVAEGHIISTTYGGYPAYKRDPMN